MQLPQYPAHDAYKDSGLPWIGSLPEHWTVERGKWLFQRAERPVRPEDEIVTCFRDGTVTLRSNRRTEGFTNALKEHGYQGIRTGDLVIHAMDAFAGAIGVSDCDGKSTPVYSACVPRVKGTVNPFFYAYYLRNLALSGVILSLAKGIRERSTDFRYNDFGELEIVFPPFEEQQAIARFLDDKTDKIDRAVKIKEGQIALLRERKQIIIQEAVTKGLNPDAPVKDSGIDWIGEIPAHWEVLPFTKYCSSAVDYRGKTPDKVESGVLLVTAKNVRDGFLDYEASREYIAKAKYDAVMSRGLPKLGDILFTTEAPLGKVAVVDDETIALAQRIIKFRLKSNLDSKFINFFLNSWGFQGNLITMSTGSTALGIKASKLNKLVIVAPPTEEQKKIVAYLEDASAKVAAAIESKQRQIETLKEYKATLINAAVTGKIKVISSSAPEVRPGSGIKLSDKA